MAKGMNQVLLIGVMARDADLRYTPSGTAVYEFTVAGEDHVTGGDGRALKLPWYHRVSMLGKPAEWQAEKGLKSGDAVVVEGSVEYSQWDDAEGGGKRSMIRVKAHRVEQLGYEAALIQDAGGGVRMDGGLNEVTLIGNVVRDPELRYTPAGDAVLGVGLAVNETWNDRQGQRQEKTHWIEATLWRELAEAHQNLKKGDPVLVKGRLVNESWTDKDGHKRNTTKVEAQRVEALLRGVSQEGAGTQAQGSGTPAQAQRPAAPQQGRAQGQASAPQGARPAGAQRPAQGGGRPQGQRQAAPPPGDLDDFPPDEEDMPF